MTTNGVIDEKICVDCKKPYKPSCNNQKRCPECMALKTHKKKTEGAPVKLHKPDAPQKSTDVSPVIAEALTALQRIGFVIVARKGDTEITLG